MTTFNIAPTYFEGQSKESQEIIYNFRKAQGDVFSALSEERADSAQAEEIKFFYKNQQETFRPALMEDEMFHTWDEVKTLSQLKEIVWDFYYMMAETPEGERFFAPDLIGKNFLFNGNLYTVKVHYNQWSVNTPSYTLAEVHELPPEEAPRGNFWAS